MKGLLKIFILLVVAFMLLGAIMVFTASGTYSISKFNNIYFLFKSHLWKVIAAGFLFWVFAQIPYDNYRKYSKYLLIGVIALLVFTFLFAPKVKGAARWIDLGFIQFQPSEAAKLILIMHLAVMIEKFDQKISEFKGGFVFPLIWIIVVSGLILIQPNVSTSLIIAATGFTLLYIGGARFKHIGFTFLSVFGIASIGIMIFKHSRERVLTYINSLSSGGDINIQVTQAKIALGSGGWFGLGLGHSRQSDLFLPESYGDFIFSILGEEMGFVGTVAVLFFYLVLFIICLIIAKKSQDQFGQLLVFGLGFNIILSAFINAGVVTGILPTTGITLPFISFGGTSIILFAVSTGIIVNVARQSMATEELRIAQVG
ncbi:MAG TPA: putative peptidoglycan glycosyltransferase FtsW [Melioribacteraceae bacterium]|nr:putative peptidoglycan glycosyltransferase FtsW [Melioribacteraceae bacterium]